MKISLGIKHGEGSMPIPVSSPESPVHYPTLYIEKLSEELPDEGEITFRFKKVSETKRNRDGEESRSVDLEMREICGVKASAKKDDEEDSGDRLDKMAKEAEDNEDEKD